MAIDYLSYTKRGFLPSPEDDDNSFLTRSDKTIDYSERIRFMAANGNRMLETMLTGTSGMFHLNNFHDLACSDIFYKIGMLPTHFVGFHTDITKVMRKNTHYKKRTNVLGICETMKFNGFELPYYVVDENNRCPIEVSVHELYHCIMRAQDAKMPFSPITIKIGSMIEEFRGDLLMTGEDIDVDRKLQIIKENSSQIRQMISEGQMRGPNTLEQLLNRPLVRESVYMKYQHNYVRQSYTKSNLALKAVAAVGSLAVGVLNPLFIAGPFMQLMLTGAGYGLGGFTAGGALHGMYSNYRVTKANKEIMSFMARTREGLNSEFGIKGANFIAYTLLLPEIREMAKQGSAKDYLHRKGTARSKALLEHAMVLSSTK